MITDRMTARVLGLLLLVLTFIIDLSTFLLTRPEARHEPRFAVIVIGTSLPFFLFGAALLWWAGRLKE